MSNEPSADIAPLQRPAPAWLADQLRADARENRFAQWGRSTVIDEYLGNAVLEPEIVRELTTLAEHPAEYPEGNAGLLHVYGYLFSNVETPFGRKSDRWLDGALAVALGLDSSALRPNGGPGTMLQRVTDAALPLFDAAGTGSANRATGPTSTRATSSAANRVAGAGSGTASGSGTGSDHVVARRADELAPGLTAHTVLSRAPGAAATALAYALELPEGIRLITLFPVAGDPTDFLAALDAEPPRLRYNAVAP